MSKFRTQFKELAPSKRETPKGLSLTIPDQTIPLKQIIKNHVRGLPTKVTNLKGSYFNTYIPPINDLNDIEDFKNSNAAIQLDLEQAIKEAKQEQEALEKEAEQKAKEDNNPLQKE